MSWPLRFPSNADDLQSFASEKELVKLRRRVASVSPIERLASVPGVGTLTALIFVLTLGRAERFAHRRRPSCRFGSS